MKKILGLLIALIALAACGQDQMTPEELEAFRQERLEMAQEDFEHLVQMLEDNFPFFGIAQRRYGLDINELFLTAWAEIEAAVLVYDDCLEDIIGSFVWEHVAMPLNFIGHISPVHSRFRGSHDYVRYCELFGIDPTQSTIETKIIEEGIIAYIRMETFLNDPFGGLYGSWSQDRIDTFEFLRQVQAFEHLIVDIRGNTGGFYTLPVDAFILPNLSETVVLEHFGFFTGGSFAARHANFHRSQRHIAFAARPGAQIRPAYEIVEQYGLIYMNQNDMEFLTWGYALSTTLVPARIEYTFSGQIWLLIDENNSSASEVFAQLAKETGLILVGETTGGVFGGIPTHFTLPNTGMMLRLDTLYITDRYGRALEEFRTDPHHFNRPNQDALETTLALIAEEAYR